MRLVRLVKPYDDLPWWFGVAWRHPFGARYVCMPIPFNWIAGWGRQVWARLRQPPPWSLRPSYRELLLGVESDSEIIEAVHRRVVFIHEVADRAQRVIGELPNDVNPPNLSQLKRAVDDYYTAPRMLDTPAFRARMRARITRLRRWRPWLRKNPVWDVKTFEEE